MIVKSAAERLETTVPGGVRNAEYAFPQCFPFSRFYISHNYLTTFSSSVSVLDEKVISVSVLLPRFGQMKTKKLKKKRSPLSLCTAIAYSPTLVRLAEAVKLCTTRAEVK